MSLQKSYPFRRVSVDHMVVGNTRVWWQLEPTFQEAGPYTFQLQSADNGLPNSNNWHNVGAPVTNAVYAIDPDRHRAGDLIVTHYRVVLTTPTNTYVSAPAACFGELDESDWLRAREIIRKELLRHQKVSIDGYLIKILRYGKACSRCRDLLTQEQTDGSCPVCFGTNYEGGYHPALEMQCWDLSPQIIQEDSDANLKGTTRENAYVTARVIGFPALNYKDIWVNGRTDERWRIEQIEVAAALRGVPLVYQVRMGAVPFTNPVYHLPLSNAAPPGPELPIIGNGCISVATNYNGNDLRYLTANSTPVSGASVHVFEKALFDSAAPALPSRYYAVAGTMTNNQGNWTNSLKLNAGDYVLLYEKFGAFGPDTKSLTVHELTTQNSSSSSSSAAASSSAVRKVNNFWEI